MLFRPRKDFRLALSEGVVALRENEDGTWWFRIPYANREDSPVELEEMTCLGEISLLADVTQDETGQVVGAIGSVPVNGKGREDKLLEQVYTMFLRYSREHNVLSGLVYEFSEAFSLGEEPLTISNKLD